MSETTTLLVEACAALAARHGGLWVGTVEVFADRLFETIEAEGIGLRDLHATAVFRLLDGALTPRGRLFTTPLGSAVHLSRSLDTTTGSAVDVVRIQLAPGEAS